jgi:twitching motility protein PilT
MINLNALLKTMCDKQASDLFLKAGIPPSLRVDGLIQVMEHEPLTPDLVYETAYGIMSEAQRLVFEQEHEMDMALGVRSLGRFRVNIYKQRGSLAMVLRHIPRPDFDFIELGLPPAVKALSERRRGLALVTGTTGSGKSTTLAAMIRHINTTRYCHIITIEDPIEFLHDDHFAIISQREVGIDTQSFLAGLKRILRQSPDVILIGEMRDLETIQTAIASAETGHLVFSTLHTTDATQTVERIINYFPGYLQQQIRMELALTLQGVISQRLLPRSDGQGRVAAAEIMIVTSTIKKLLYEGKTLEIKDFIADGGMVGMMTFDQCLYDLWAKGLITQAEALNASTSPDELNMRFEGVTSGVKRGDMTDFIEV